MAHRHKFGQKTPPLYKYIQDILIKYPDGGQILKELIQNAEDAGASEVRFLYDQTQYGEKTLRSPKLVPCQGPALCAYNDACFTEEDWENIQNLSMSVKKGDPMKIGRFGQGFNSVYHLTDLPMILSGSRVAILDPHKNIFLIDGELQSGCDWHLIDDAEEMERLQDQFSPFKNLFEFEGAEDPFKTGFFDGTIFRFPLRQKPSKISATLYDDGKIVDLFDSFKSDGDIVLLFLHHVRSVKLISRKDSGQSATEYRVSMSNPSEHERASRFHADVEKALKVPVDNRETIVNTCRFSMTVDGLPTQDWLVTNYVKGRGISEEAQKLSEELSLLPWVGVAMPMAAGGGRKLDGRTFCCLPLPEEPSLSTGLPVHVHGFFGVSDNRRSLKWTGTDQKSDSAAKWNEVLVREILPSAYARLVTDATHCCDRDALYRALPDMHHTAQHWKPALRPFFNIVLNQKVVWTPANDGKWITPKDAVFNRTSVSTAVLDYLVGAGLDVVELPKHVMQAVDHTFSRSSLNEVTPELLRTTMKRTGVQNWLREYKLAWLEYALDDKKYAAMEGIELLPLADKTFTTFSTKHDKTIFIDSEEHPRTLLPGLSGRFLDTDIDNPTLHHLQKAAREAEGKARTGQPCLQLRHLTPQLVASHLRDALPPDWLQVSHVTWYLGARSQQPSADWLPQLWQYLKAHFAEDLSPFVGLPILPVVGTNATHMVRLEQPSTVIRPKYGETTMPDVIKNLVRDVGAKVLEGEPPYLNHPRLEEFIHRCTPQGLLRLLIAVGADKVVPKVGALSAEAKGALRAFFAKGDSLHDTERRLLAKLPIFEAVDDSNLKPRYLAALGPGGNMRQIAPDLTTDPLTKGLSFPTTLIVTRDLESQTIGQLLGLQHLSTTELLAGMIEKVRRGDYTTEQTDSLMLWILKRLHTLQATGTDPSILKKIQTLPFVTSNSNTKVAPTELFSPEETDSGVLLGEPVFPGPPYAEKAILAPLLLLGMRQKVSAQDILRSAKNVQTFYDSGKLTLPDTKRKAAKIVSVLDHRMLTTLVKGVFLKTALMDVSFLPVCSERPSSYLPGLQWYPEANNAAFVSPRDARGSECAELVGATMPIVDDGRISADFISAFGWDKDRLPIKKVVEQLKTLCIHYRESTRPDKHRVVQMLTKIYQHIDARLAAGETSASAALRLLSSPGFPPWVWQGDGLAAANAVALTSPFNFSLAPYRFILPEDPEFRDFEQMFKGAGVKESLNQTDLVETLQEINQQSTPKMSTEVERDLKLSVDIIGWLVHDPDIHGEVQERMLVPIATKDSTCVVLEPVSECTYNDESWSDAQDILDEDEGFKLLHELIPLDTAQRLGVPSLSQRVVDAEEFGFDQCGQYEKVTQRLKNILNDDPGGAGIFKELIQNADDARATEVKFLVDWRKNEESRKDLIDKGMEVCHGPALWAYNNATFSEEDFKNIQNLGGQTKLEALEKVGRFGVGFNSVYLVTDVPSFVSGSRVMFFDPHATHLSKHIKDKSKPGIGLDLQKNKRLARFINQFKPFQGVFGYSTSTPYRGTLFRLPLRTPQEAAVSEISAESYSTPDNKNLKKVTESFKEGLKSLILFTQNVRQVTMYTLDESEDPSSMVETLHVSKSPVKYLREMQIQSPSHSHKMTDKFQFQSNCLLATSEVVKRQGTIKTNSKDCLETSMIVKVTCRQKEGKDMSEEWIISSCMGTEMSERGKTEGLVPCGGVAALLKSSDGSHQGASKDSHPPSGEVFCFLPLSIRTDLPVHVNGSFAVASNRGGLWEETSTDPNDQKVEWNKALMEDAVCKAYITMLLDLSDMAKKGLLLDILTPYQYHRFWPNPRHITGTSHYSVLVRAFYDALTSHGTPPPLFESGGQWLSFTSAVFLDPGIAFNSCENVAARRALQQCLPDYTVVELPEWAQQGFEQAGCAKLLSDHTYTEERFYRKLFFPMIHELSNKTRDPLMLRILGRENGEYHDLIRTTACIPTSPRGQELSCPGDLIHPDGKLSAMFLPEDQRFPHGSKDTAYLKPSRLQVLTELGMCKDDAPWDVVIERAESVVRLNEVNQNASRKRIVALLDFIDEKTRDKRDKKGQQQAGKQLSTIPFLPIMQKAHEWPFDWKGSEYPAYALLSAAELQPSKNVVIAGVSCPIMCSRIVTTRKGRHSSTYTVPHSLSSFLGLEDKPPNLSETLTNLMAIVAVDMKTLSKEGLDCTKKTYLKTCQHLQKLCKGSKCNENEIATRLSKTPFIMIMSQTAKRFLLPSDVSFGLKFSCAPYLYRVPDELATELRPLLLVCKVKKTFEACDFIRALDHLKEDRGNKTLESHEVNLALALLKAASDLEEEDIQKRSLWIPDESGVLRRPSGVCYNDCAWIKQKEGMVFCHKGLARDLAVDKLGVKPVRHKSLEAYSHNLSCFGTDFGQVEQLTNRIKNLLDAYPFGKEILKELLQNADDAGATEIQFVFDKRHHGTKYIFDDAWKDLQGPALCVYNNRPFTEEDLTGIQNLGKGSKGQDPVKTGKYGVGFNAVYHLTDCPSFMTGGDTLCVFDPQLRFVPGAKQECPGRMLRDIDAELREQYKDVFGCYLKDQAEFSSPDSTMFRFPLRTATMAEGSEISNKEVTEKTILELIDTFKEESFEVLLFLNSVEKIKISIIETDGTSKEVYHAEAIISEEAKQDRREFADYVAECAHSEEPLEELATHHVTYNLDLRDNSQHQESWIVHQRIGFEDKDIPNSIKEAHASSELGLLPRGGAAICHKHCKQPAISKAHHQSESDQKCYHMGPKRAFCFLPLPIDTKLPVHVNGHFALDHEAQRNLWKDEKGGMKSDWNKTLIKEVIAPAYAAVLDAKRAADFDEEQKQSSAPKAQNVYKSLESYHSLFPSVSKTADQWNDLSIAFYQHIEREHLRLLPVLRSTADDCRPNDGEPLNSSHNHMALEWLPPTGAGKDEAFFNTLEYRDAGSTESDKKPRRQVLKETLLALGFKLLASPNEILDAFQEAEVDVKEVKPESVVNFLQTYADDDPLCRIGASLPAQLSSTSFKEPENVQVALHYCLSSTIDKNKEHKLHGVPLLLTSDKILRVFDLSNPVFATKFANLVPSAPHLFVDRSCLSDLQRQYTDKSVLSFDVEALSSLLPLELNESKLRQGNTVEWNQSPPQYWIYRLWQFLDHEMPKKESDQDTYLSTIKTLFGNWAVLPACTHSPTMGRYDASTFSTYDRIPMVQSGKTYMVPLGEAHTVVTFDVRAPSLQQIKVAKAMRKLHCLELNIHSLRAPPDRPFNAKPTQLARRFVSSLTNHVGILRVLTSLFDAQRAATSTPLDADDATELLKYFEEEVDKLKTEEANLDMLRSLPLYKTIHEKLISLRTTIQCHVLPAGIPTADMDEWINRSGAVFLEGNHSLKKLHTALGCSRITDAEVYRQYIFPNMDHLSDEAVKEHLEYLRQMLISMDTVEKHARTRESLLASLRHLRIIPSEGGRKPVSDFYDDGHPVFREMVSDENFLPEYYRTGMWKKFFVEIGIIHKVKNELFLQYARKVENLARVTRSKESRLTEKSNVLVEHFFTTKTLSEGSFIKEVSGIRFIAPVEARPDLVKLHSQHGANGDVLPFVCFKDSVPEHKQELCWTRANLLPNSVIQKLQYQGDSKALCRQLGIQVQPSMDTVTNHVTCLCQHLAHQKNTEMEEGANSPSACKALWKVMLEVYKFLSKKASEGGSLKKKLGNVPCMAVEEGRRLVRPEQVAINLDQEHEIRPYLYGMPIELGQYHKLFVSLGATEKPTPMQYAKVLEALYVSSGGQPLNPNEKTATYSAIFGLFRCLKPESSIQFGKGKPYKTREVEDSFHKLQCLYLPSRESRLLKSAELVFDDTPHFTDRVKDGFNYPILVRLENCRLFADEHELIDRLPSHLRPKNLSSLVQEQLCDEDEQMTCTMGANCVLESRLASLFLSTYFRHAIVRLSKHALGERCDDKKVIAAVEKFVSSVTVCCKRKLITCLVYKESQDRIEDSEGTSYCFIKDNTLYVAHTDAASEEHESFLCELTEVINDGLGRPLVNLVHLGMVLSVKDPSDIPKKLDRAKIKRYTSGEQDDSPLPTLGTPIPEIYHHLLTSNPAHYFTPGDYVGFEVYDTDFETDSEEEEKEYTMTFLYAQVIKEEPTDTELKFNMGREYVIDVGYKKTVSAVDLYKFCRPYVPGPLVPYEGETGKDDASAAKPPQSLEDAMEEVSNILEEAWKLPGKERKKVVRRLYLQWHPDKNPDNVELATEVTKHILAEISRLEKGLPRRTKGGDGSGGGDFDFGGSSFSSSFTRWNAYAGYHRHQREQFHERYRGGDFSGWRTGSGQWVPPRSDGGGFPNPREAARWHRQAAADLRAARSNLSGPDASYEWTCLMCHQAAEKALKAVQLGKFGRYDMIHRIGDMGRALEASCGGKLAGLGDAAMELSSLGSYPGCDDVYLRARYPNLHPAPRVPHDAFTRQHAESAVRLAQSILDKTEDVSN
ncbi:PREDICTED: sacsin-like [Branchiostoma belcheri]|uniref:Sacsin-like n=1 Tax=Branchiostoma belcheri TaxID=7741 RepID=A0A6P4XZF3_BRABE|nr:PREDICTED: sacsin-like [Branchiostoma belcheri]